MSTPVIEPSHPSQLKNKMSVSDHATDDATTTNNMDHYVQEMKHEEPMLEFSEDEEDLVARMFRLVGKRWSLIAGRIPGRTAEEVERHWTSKYAPPSEQCSSSAKGHASENVISTRM